MLESFLQRLLGWAHVRSDPPILCPPPSKENRVNDEVGTWAEIGLGLNGQFRDYLERLRLRDPSLRWHEGRGFITRRYEIVGSRNTIAKINLHLQAWSQP
jgi:hypothetical protein